MLNSKNAAQAHENPSHSTGRSFWNDIADFINIFDM